MSLKNTTTHYGSVSKWFHWIMAVLVIGMLILGLYMSDLPSGIEKLDLYGYHKSFGILILCLVIFRLIWRLSNIQPALEIPNWEKFSAITVHWLLYFLMFAMPLSGWLMTSAGGHPPSFFGWFILPELVSPSTEKMHIFKTIHVVFAYSLIALILLHTAAALKHHFIDKDIILTRML